MSESLSHGCEDDLKDKGQVNYGLEEDDNANDKTSKIESSSESAAAKLSTGGENEEKEMGSISLSILTLDDDGAPRSRSVRWSKLSLGNADSINDATSDGAADGREREDTAWSESAIDNQLGPPDRQLLKGATTNLQTMTHIFKGNVGPGILAMPYAFANIGLIPGIFMTVLIALINVHCMRLVVFASHKLCFLTRKQTLDYGYCMDYAFKTLPGASSKFQNAGRWMRKAVNLFLQITQLGFCCVYFVFISENLGQVINHRVFGVVDDPRGANESTFDAVRDLFDANGTSSTPAPNATTPAPIVAVGLAPRIYMTMLLPFIMALSCVRDMRTLAYCSTVANILCITGFLMIFIQLLQDLPPIESISWLNKDYTLWPIYIATTVYAFEGIGVVLPLENKMRTPSALLPWNGVLNTAMTVVSALFLAMGFFGYLKYGNKCRGSITLNLPPHATINEVVKVMFAVAVYFTYSVQFFVPVQIIWPILKKRVTKENWVNPAEILFRCLLVTFTYALAVAIPHLGPFISLIGAFASTALAMLFPVIIDTVANWRPTRGSSYSYSSSISISAASNASTASRAVSCLVRLRFAKNLFIFIFGLISFIFGTTESIRQIVEAFSKTD